MLIAMTALQRHDGVPPTVAFDRALAAWREHIKTRGNDSFELSDLKALVAKLTADA